MPPDKDKDKKDVDLSKILLPKKEEKPGATPASASRVNAAALLEQEQKAATGGTAAPKTQPTPTPTKPKEESLVKPLETYRGAIEEAIQHQNVSVVSIAAAEAKRRGEAATDAPKPQPHAPSSHDLGFNIAAVAGGAVLIAGATALLLFVFFRPQANAPVVVAPQSPFISVDDTQLIAIAPAQWQRNAVMGEINAAKESVALSLGLMARLYVAQATSSGAVPPPAGVGTFLATIAPNIPDELLRSFTGEYLLGVHSFDGNQAFLILGVESYEAGYAGMLEWELAMPNELSPLFDRIPRPRIPEENVVPLEPVPILPAATSSATSTTATSTPATSTPSAPLPDFFRTRFIDRIVENHDARVIQDINGDILLLWTFLDRNTLVITTNEYTLREIISRRSRPPTITI